MVPDTYREAARLIREERWAALGTLNGGAPLASMVSYACEADLGAFLMLLSPLALHTRNLLDDPRASLAVSRPDGGEGDPQELARVTVSGSALALVPGTPEWEGAKAVYAARFPGAEVRMSLPDILVFRFVPEEVRYVGGFGRATRMTAAQLREASREA